MIRLSEDRVDPSERSSPCSKEVFSLLIEPYSKSINAIKEQPFGFKWCFLLKMGAANQNTNKQTSPCQLSPGVLFLSPPQQTDPFVNDNLYPSSSATGIVSFRDLDELDDALSLASGM